MVKTEILELKHGVQKHWKMISIYSITHFFVDFACAFLMFFHISNTSEWYTSLLLYNFCAFAMQMPIGIIADKLNRNHLFAAAGCVMIAAAYGLTSLPLVAAIVLGLGNGMFHIGGGIDILNISEKKSSALGIFISPGAFGVYFGTILGRTGASLTLPILIALLIAAGMIFTMNRERVHTGTNVPNASFSPEVPPKLFIAVICLFFVVCLRSYVGLAIDFPWKNTGYWGLAIVCASAFGKVLGGFLSDRYGPAKVAALSLGLAALLFLLPQIPVAGVPAILLFNMTMPITLWLIARMVPGAKGFSFGLLTFALFLGFLPVYLGTDVPPFWVFAPLAAISLVLLMLVQRIRNN